MKFYEKWKITLPNGKTCFEGSFKDIMENYKLTSKQLWDMMINQTFPTGTLSKTKEYTDFNMEKELMRDGHKFKGQWKPIFKKLILNIQMGDDRFLEHDADYYLENFDPDLCCEMLKKTLALNNRIEIHKAFIKHQWETHKDKEDVVLCVLPKKYDSLCFVRRSWEDGFDLYKYIISECCKEKHCLRLWDMTRDKAMIKYISPNASICDILTHDSIIHTSNGYERYVELEAPLNLDVYDYTKTLFI